MILKQYYLSCLSHASYLIGDEAAGTAVVVDPQRDVDAYVRDAAEQGLTIKDVVLTHFHADFVAGHLELARRTGASISLGAKADASFPFTPRRDGAVLEHGNVSLRVMETPGHTPEGISLVVSEGGIPKAVLTGDTLFPGDVGRPDLMASKGHSAQDLAGQLYDSLHQKLLPLPDDVKVYPAHGPGSMCGSGSSSDVVSTIGQERALNPSLQPMPKETFVTRVTTGLPPAPDYFGRDALINRTPHDTLEQVVERSRRPLSVDEAILMQNQGAQVLDVREPDAYASGHLIGSVNIGLDGRFAQWAGVLLDPQRPIVVVAPAGREEETLLRLGRVGLDNVAGYVAGGIEGRPDLTEPTQRTSPQALADLLAGPSAPMVLDVRTPGEYQGAHIEGSVNIPLAELPRRQDEVPRDRPVVVHCASGYRSSAAVSVLQQQCRGCFTDLTGGIAAWQAAGLPVVRSA